MIIGSLNIAKRLESAAAILEEIIRIHNIDILCLQETDLKQGSQPPFIKNFYPVYSSNNSGTIRVVSYVKYSVSAEQISIQAPYDFPAVAIKLKEIVVINFYNEFTLFSYSDARRRLSKPEQTSRLVEFMKETSDLNRKIIYLGDANVDLLDTHSNLTNEYEKACNNLELDHEVRTPTRNNKCLDHIMTRAILPSESKTIDTLISDHNLILTKVGKSPRRTIQYTKQILPDAAMRSWLFTPLAFVDAQRDIDIMTEEIRFVQSEAFKIFTRKIKPRNAWYNDTSLVQLRHDIVTAVDPEKARKLKNKYINCSRSLKRDALNNRDKKTNVWNLIRQERKKICIDIGGKMSEDPQLLVPKFKSAFKTQSSTTEVTPDAIQNLREIIGSNKSWSFKYVTNAHVSQVIRDAAAKASC